MTRFSLTIILSLFVLISSAQTRTNNVNAQPGTTSIKITLLGTGTPQPIMKRFGPSILVQAGSENLLFDAGRGCLQRLLQINLPYNKLDALFLTHLHSDHITGLPDLWLTGWLVSNRTTPLKVFGPTGTAGMLNHLRQAFAFDIRMRVEDDKRVEEGSKFLISEIKQGVVYERNGVKVTAITVDHRPIVPAFGYRIDYNGHSVVLSGDTRYSSNLVSFAKGADLLIHEVGGSPDTLTKSDPQYNILQHHTSPEQAANVFNQVHPKLAAYSHIVKLHGLTEDDIMKRTKKIYNGPLIMGEDLMSFEIGDTVSVVEWANK